MYNILEDQTVNQTKHDWQLGNIAILFVAHVFCTDKYDLFLTWKIIQNYTQNSLTCIIELNQTVN